MSDIPLQRSAFSALMRVCIPMLIACAACAPQTAQVFQATVPATQNSAPVYTPTPTFTPSATPTATATSTPLPTTTPTPAPTQPVQTLTPIAVEGAPPAVANTGAALSDNFGWSCDDFPCEDDIDGFMARIQVPPGFALAHVGRFPGQPMQLAYGRDGLLYATVLENGTRNGAVYRMNADGSTDRYSGDFVSPLGLAFQPGTDVLYVSAREALEQGGGVWRVHPGGGEPEAVVSGLPCCFQIIDNQPNGLVFGPDGYLYMGIGALTDQGEPPPGNQSQYPEVGDYEAAVVRIHPHTGEMNVYARGLRNPFDLTFDSAGQGYATDSGLLAGTGDRLVALQQDAHFGFPYYRERGCDRCPPTPPDLAVAPDLLGLPAFTLPRGIVAYTGTQYPENMIDSLFVAFWNGTPHGQRIVRIDPERIPTDPDALAGYEPEPFVTGLIRPIDIVMAPDGALVIADAIYGHVWQVAYEG